MADLNSPNVADWLLLPSLLIDESGRNNAALTSGCVLSLLMERSGVILCLCFKTSLRKTFHMKMSLIYRK